MTPEQESILSSYRVDGKVAVVTGGSRGIGFGCAQALAEAGAEVVLVARAGPGLEEAAASDRRGHVPRLRRDGSGTGTRGSRWSAPDRHLGQQRGG